MHGGPLRPFIKILLLVLLVLAAFVFYIKIGGSQSISWGQVIYDIFHPGGNTATNLTIWQLRLPRACECLVVGAILGIVGSAFQALFRNPLAEPYVVGVSSGAAVGGALAILIGFGSTWTGFALGLGKMILAFPAGLLSLAIVYGLARRKGVLQVQTLLLAGVVTGALFSSVMSLILLMGGQDERQILGWLLGSMTPAFWNRIEVMLIVLVLGSAVLIAYSKQLNAFALDEGMAQRLGVNTARLKPAVLIAGTAMVASTVGAVGIIGFLGLVAPHTARRLLGVDWRWSLVGSAFLGSALLLVSDLLAQHLLAGADLPVGIVTAVIGAPVLLLLLRGER
jgi:iron complex transport system permease protein